MGDLNALVDSIRRLKLLQPIGVTEDLTLVFGEGVQEGVAQVNTQTRILSSDQGYTCADYLVSSTGAPQAESRSHESTLSGNLRRDT
jgi:hypothetical protein